MYKPTKKDLEDMKIFYEQNEKKEFDIWVEMMERDFGNKEGGIQNGKQVQTKIN